MDRRLMLTFDAWLTHLINGSAGHDPTLDAALISVTQAGVPALVLAVVLGWWVRGDRFLERQAAIGAGLSFLLGLALNQIIILIVARARPYDAGVSQLIVARSADPSFPSDHATAAFAIAASVWLSGLKRRALAFGAAACLIALSRVYVGTHYLGDILGGAATGSLAAGAVHLTRFRRERLDRLLARVF